MRILITGSRGQVGEALQLRFQDRGEVLALDRAALDLANADAIRAAVRRFKPELILNAAAYTAVDRAESDEVSAQAINGKAPGILAAEARRLDALLLHYSTDYVFDGRKNAPYIEEDPTGPLGVYGRTKLAGEQAIAASGCRHLILRSSWIYGARGQNFMLTMLRLARERPQLRVVNDQIGAPTWSHSLADMTLELLDRDPPSGIYHATDGGETSWHGFATEILKLAGIATPIVAIPTEDYPTPAQRPRNSRLDNEKRIVAGGTQQPWEDSLRECLGELQSSVEGQESREKP
jgi:dTDP-4-dehydrorhamnose reductase